MKKELIENTIQNNVRLIDAIKAIKQNKNRCIIVCNKNKVIGVLSEGDIMSALLNKINLHSSISNCMNVNFKFMTELNYQKALELVLENGITMIPIVNEEFHLKNVITFFDILQNVRLDLKS